MSNLEEKLRRVGESQAKELEAAKGCMVKEQQQVSIKLAEAMKQLGKVEEEKEEMEKQLYKASTATESLNVAEAKVAELEKVVEDLKFEVEEAEKQRDMVDTACDKEGWAGDGSSLSGMSGMSGRWCPRW